MIEEGIERPGLERAENHDESNGKKGETTRSI
jgi:hypothetical protein